MHKLINTFIFNYVKMCNVKYRTKIKLNKFKKNQKLQLVYRKYKFTCNVR